MKNLRFLSMLVLFSLLVISACRKDLVDDNNNTPMNPTVMQGSEIANVTGLVSDAIGLPISNADVTLNGEVISTDQNGYFRFTEKMLSSGGSLATFSKVGYFDTYQFVYPTSPGENAYAEVTLNVREITGTFQSGDGSTISTPRGATVSFSPNSIIDEDGNTYNGEVNVYTHWYNPLSEELQQSMPGDLRGTDEEGNVVQLATFGMLAVEIETPSGESLNIGNDNTAQLTFPLEGLSDSAPDKIPLWYLDEATGVWVEEGVATKSGDQYIGDVSHFSFWNCDVPYPLVYLSGTIEDQAGNPVTHTRLTLKIIDNNQGLNTSSGWTDQNGRFYGKVPQDQLLLLEIRDQCGDIAHSEEIGPFSVDTDLGTIIVDLEEIITISGMVTDCEGNLIDDGYVALVFDDQETEGNAIYLTVPVEEDGGFSYTGNVCGRSGYVQAYDAAAGDFSPTVAFQVSELANMLNLGLLSLCTQEEEFLIYNVDGQSFAHTDVELCIINGNAIFTSEQPVGDIFPMIHVDNLMEGEQTSSGYLLIVNGEEVVCDLDCNTMTIDVTQSGSAIGDFIEGTISGSVVTDNIGGVDVEAEISGSFRVAVDRIADGGSISGMVWFDEESDGIRNEGELPYHIGLTLTLGDQSVVTNSEGRYAFTGLKPGEHTISYLGAQSASPTDQGNDDTIDNDFTGMSLTITLAESEIVENVDLGLPQLSSGLNCLPHTVIEEYCEGGAGMINVNFTGGVAPFVYSIRSQDGFTVMESSTSTEFDISSLPPGDYATGVSDASGSNCIFTFSLSPFSAVVRINTIVWEDIDENGAFDPNIDIRVPGTVLSLYRDDDDSLDSQSAPFWEEWYAFLFIRNSGSYYIVATPPSGFRVTEIPGAPVTGLINSSFTPDFDTNTARSETISLTACENDFVEIGVALVRE